jgi:branched-chain amino acid transport system permease protein
MPAVAKRFSDFTGGSTGINLFGRPELTGSGSGIDLWRWHLAFYDWLYYLCWGIALLAFIVAWLVLRGRMGLALRAVRDSEIAAVSFGVSLGRYKTLAFGISAAFAGVAGALFALANGFLNPDAFGVLLSIELLIGVVVGGLGRLSGLVLGAYFIAFFRLYWAQGEDLGSLLPHRLIEETQKPGGPAMVYGFVLILLMFVLPTGVGGLFGRIAQLFTRRR